MRRIKPHRDGGGQSGVTPSTLHPIPPPAILEPRQPGESETSEGDQCTFRICLLLTLCVAMSLSVASVAIAVDTDGDGLLDLMDVHGFDPSASGTGSFRDCGIQDLDGASQLTNLQWLHLYGNQITSIESGDFDGLTNLQTLDLTTIKSRASRAVL